MKQILAVTLTALLTVITTSALADDVKRHWLNAPTSADDSHFGDMSRAIKVATKGDFARLYAEGGGKLVLIWEAKNPAAAGEAKKVARDNPTEWAPIEEEQFINLRKVVSVDIKKDSNGKETAILIGASGKLGTVTDQSAIATVRDLVQK